MISVDTTLPPEEHSTLVPFTSELTLSITISDVRGEVEVLKNWNIVCATVNGVTLTVIPSEEMNLSSGAERLGISILHCSSVSFGVVRHVRFS